MPGGRGRRGGVRVGTQGSTYQNRTDLNTNRALPITAPTGLPYGEHKALVDTQQAVPIRPPATPAPAAPALPAVVASAPPQAPPAAAVTPMHAPSQRPNEPITAGLPVGAGPGPEALGLAAGQPGRLADVIAAAASTSGSSDLAFLADRARNLGQ